MRIRMSLIRLLEAGGARRQHAAEPAEEPDAEASPADVAAIESESEAEKQPAVELEPEPELVPRLAVLPPPTDPEPEPEPEPGPAVVHLVLRDPTPRSWNLWQLEGLAASKDGDRARGEERALLLLHLRQFASAAGDLPAEFDLLVRKAFGADLAELVS